MQRHLLEFGRSILLQATKPQTCPFNGRPYVEDMKIQGVKIVLKWGLAKLPRSEHAETTATLDKKKRNNTLIILPSVFHESCPL